MTLDTVTKAVMLYIAMCNYTENTLHWKFFKRIKNLEQTM